MIFQPRSCSYFGPPRGAAAALALVVCVMAGCAGYQTWPPPSGEAVDQSLNSNSMTAVMQAGLAWIIKNRPPQNYDGRVAVNIPPGIRHGTYHYVVTHASDRADPVTPDIVDRPIYHVTGIRVRGSDAELTVLRPAMEVAPGYWELEKYTLTLDGGLNPWTVTRPRPWILDVEPPPLNFYDPENPTGVSGP